MEKRKKTSTNPFHPNLLLPPLLIRFFNSIILRTIIGEENSQKKKSIVYEENIVMPCGNLFDCSHLIH